MVVKLLRKAILKNVLKNTKSLTAQYLNKKKKLKFQIKEENLIKIKFSLLKKLKQIILII